jgi:hypothetical protein
MHFQRLDKIAEKSIELRNLSICKDCLSAACEMWGFEAPCSELVSLTGL